MLLEELKVYKELCQLALNVHEITMKFPKFEMYELGSQLRRSSNSSPANLAEGFNSKHTKIYTECISRSQGEIRETKHHLRMAHSKKYITDTELELISEAYTVCSKMLYRLDQALHKKINHRSYL